MRVILNITLILAVVMALSALPQTASAASLRSSYGGAGHPTYASQKLKKQQSNLSRCPNSRLCKSGDYGCQSHERIRNTHRRTPRRNR